MKNVPLDKLTNKIVRPGIEKHLTPLLAYRGQLTLGRAHRCWNLMLSMKAHECTIADATQRLMMNGEFSQLCLPEKPLQHLSLRSFISRLKLNPDVMKLEPGLEEYVWWVDPRPGFQLTPVSPISHRSRHKGAGGWREVVLRPRGPGKLPKPECFDKWVEGKTAREAVARYGRSIAVIRRWFDEAGIRPANPLKATQLLSYPFLIHDGGRPEHILLKKVNDAVPRHFRPETRADICQDIVVGILCGDFEEDDLDLPAQEMVRKVLQMFPTKYGPLSLDALIPGSKTPFVDLLADEGGRRWDSA